MVEHGRSCRGDEGYEWCKYSIHIWNSQKYEIKPLHPVRGQNAWGVKKTQVLWFTQQESARILHDKPFSTSMPLRVMIYLLIFARPSEPSESVNTRKVFMECRKDRTKKNNILCNVVTQTETEWKQTSMKKERIF